MLRQYHRRQFIQIFASLGFGYLTSFWMACGAKEPSDSASATPASCDDLSSLSDIDLKYRKSYAYVDSSPISDQLCSNCNLFLPHKELKNCGNCLLFKGPVKGDGYCTSWAPQVG